MITWPQYIGGAIAAGLVLGLADELRRSWCRGQERLAAMRASADELAVAREQRRVVRDAERAEAGW